MSVYILIFWGNAPEMLNRGEGFLGGSLATSRLEGVYS